MILDNKCAEIKVEDIVYFQKVNIDVVRNMAGDQVNEEIKDGEDTVNTVNKQVTNSFNMRDGK